MNPSVVLLKTYAIGSELVWTCLNLYELVCVCWGCEVNSMGLPQDTTITAKSDSQRQHQCTGTKHRLTSYRCDCDTLSPNEKVGGKIEMTWIFKYGKHSNWGQILRIWNRFQNRQKFKRLLKIPFATPHTWYSCLWLLFLASPKSVPSLLSAYLPSQCQRR